MKIIAAQPPGALPSGAGYEDRPQGRNAHCRSPPGRPSGRQLRPSVAIPVLRDLTRNRTKLVQYQSAIANHIQKLLEQCKIKLASVASHALGVSAMAMLRALAQGKKRIRCEWQAWPKGNCGRSSSSCSARGLPVAASSLAA